MLEYQKKKHFQSSRSTDTYVFNNKIVDKNISIRLLARDVNMLMKKFSITVLSFALIFFLHRI